MMTAKMNIIAGWAKANGKANRVPTPGHCASLQALYVSGKPLFRPAPVCTNRRLSETEARPC
jgi:hypothetical protein